MDERRQEFRVGLMVVAAMVAIVIMVFQFGAIGRSWKSGTRIGIILPTAAGIVPDTALKMSGLRIGHVEKVTLLPEGRGVLVQTLVNAGYTFPDDSVAQVQRSLLGDGSIEISPGHSATPIQNGSRIVGNSVGDPGESISRLEDRLSATLHSFETTGREWGRLAHNLNRILESSGPGGVSTLEQSAVALEQFTRTMKTAEDTLAAAGGLLNDPRYQQQLQRTLVALPELLNETQSTLRAVNGVVQQVDTTVANLNTATRPLAAQSESLVTQLNQSMANIQTMTRELAVITQLMNQNDGTLKKLITDPAMYRNLNSTASSLAALLQNLQPVVADLQVFSDKVARHPELLGIRGAMRGSSGIKDSQVQPAAFEQPGGTRRE
ncbi:MAG: MlaD family protein [Planctomycetaceae bacterium]